MVRKRKKPFAKEVKVVEENKPAGKDKTAVKINIKIFFKRGPKQQKIYL